VIIVVSYGFMFVVRSILVTWSALTATPIPIIVFGILELVPAYGMKITSAATSSLNSNSFFSTGVLHAAEDKGFDLYAHALLDWHRFFLDHGQVQVQGDWHWQGYCFLTCFPLQFGTNLIFDHCRSLAIWEQLWLG